MDKDKEMSEWQSEFYEMIKTVEWKYQPNSYSSPRLQLKLSQILGYIQEGLRQYDVVESFEKLDQWHKKIQTLGHVTTRQGHIRNMPGDYWVIFPIGIASSTHRISIQ